MPDSLAHLRLLPLASRARVLEKYTQKYTKSIPEVYPEDDKRTQMAIWVAAQACTELPHVSIEKTLKTIEKQRKNIEKALEPLKSNEKA